MANVFLLVSRATMILELKEREECSVAIDQAKHTCSSIDFHFDVVIFEVCCYLAYRKRIHLDLNQSSSGEA